MLLQRLIFVVSIFQDRFDPQLKTVCRPLKELVLRLSLASGCRFKEVEEHPENSKVIPDIGLGDISLDSDI